MKISFVLSALVTYLAMSPLLAQAQTPSPSPAPPTTDILGNPLPSSCSSATAVGTQGEVIAATISRSLGVGNVWYLASAAFGVSGTLTSTGRYSFYGVPSGTQNTGLDVQGSGWYSTDYSDNFMDALTAALAVATTQCNAAGSANAVVCETSEMATDIKTSQFGPTLTNKWVRYRIGCSEPY